MRSNQISLGKKQEILFTHCLVAAFGGNKGNEENVLRLLWHILSH